METATNIYKEGDPGIETYVLSFVFNTILSFNLFSLDGPST